MSLRSIQAGLAQSVKWLTEYGLNDRGLTPGRGKEGIFLFITASRPTLGPTQPPIQLLPGIFSPEVKRPGRETDHSPPSSAEVKNVWRYTSNLGGVFS
jgi:hypothetical protein